jgi:hypothetical protein
MKSQPGTTAPQHRWPYDDVEPDRLALGARVIESSSSDRSSLINLFARTLG